MMARNSSPMQICYDYQIFAAQKYGGISRYFIETALRIQQRQDAAVRVIAPLYQSKLLESKRRVIPVVGTCFSSEFKKASGLCLRAGAILSSAVGVVYRPDIVHETYYSAKQTMKPRGKTVLTVYDMIAELFPRNGETPPTLIPTRKAAFERADHLICISENTRADLIRLYGVEPAKISVIPLASSITASKMPLAATGDPFFLYVGGRWGYKNFLGLAKAYFQSGLYKSHKLVCFGGGTFADRELRQFKEEGLPIDRFEIVDGDDEMLARYYGAAVALIYPSLYEGFGIPLLEAMDCSCPVLCGNSSSLPEVAGDAAAYFDASEPSDIARAMLEVANSAEERTRLIQKGKDRVMQFSWDKCAQQTYAVYERLLSKK